MARYAAFGVERALLTDRQWYDYTVWRNRRGVSAAADPRQLRYVDPTRIRRASPFNPRFCWRKLGQVRGGDWDRDCRRLDDRFDDVHEALEARYVDGTPWEEIALPNAVAAGDRHRWHFATGDDVWGWVEDLDALYRSIRDRGYMPVREILDMDFEEAAHTDYGSASERFRPVANGSLFFGERDETMIFDWMDDIRVDIGRDGEVLRHNGRHRLWFAKHLGVDRIPVCVVVRHERWQRLRDEVAAAADVEELSGRARRHLDHPDMVDVRGSIGGASDGAAESRVTVER
ncbi:hypothetical protein [Halobaculum sp. EA56]|uniref:hypothetical protein n=1 Tax=Halobaculum sp. EA56 TaxID=3421648 RepID=UPI003EBC73B5